MAPTLYYVPGSAPCRAVLLSAKALNLDLDLKLVDLHHGEHLKPEYLKVTKTSRMFTHSLPTYCYLLPTLSVININISINNDALM